MAKATPPACIQVVLPASRTACFFNDSLQRALCAVALGHFLERCDVLGARRQVEQVLRCCRDGPLHCNVFCMVRDSCTHEACCLGDFLGRQGEGEGEGET